MTSIRTPVRSYCFDLDLLHVPDLGHGATVRASSGIPRRPATMASGKHVFEVTNYSLHRCLDAGSFVHSPTLDVGGYAWSILFFPGGYPPGVKDDSGDYVAVGLVLVTDGVLVEFSRDMALVDMTTGERWFGDKSDNIEIDTRTPDSLNLWCFTRFRRRDDLEASPYLHEDRVVVECTLTVIQGSQSKVRARDDEIAVTPAPLLGLPNKNVRPTL